MATKDSRLSRAGVSGYNKPKKTPSHPTKSHVVVAKSGDQVKTIRFGQQGVKGSPDGSKRNEAFKARHAKNIAKGKMSAAYWADKVSIGKAYFQAFDESGAEYVSGLFTGDYTETLRHNASRSLSVVYPWLKIRSKQSEAKLQGNGSPSRGVPQGLP